MTTILIIQSGPQLSNVGDIAMLQVGLKQVSQRWTESTFFVVADDPVKLGHYCPQAQWASALGCALWASPLIGRRVRHVPIPLAGVYDACERFARYRVAALGNLFVQRRAGRSTDGDTHLASFCNAMRQADIVVATGGGYLNDEFPRYARIVLRCLEWAIQAKKPAFMFGQGIGPLTDAGVRVAAQRVLPQVDLIALREQRTSLPLLRALGVPDERIRVTGDDAIELAYSQRRHDLGSTIGVNLRRAHYARVTPAQIAAVGRAVCAVADMLQAPLLPIPMATLAEDQASIAELLQTVPPVAGDDDGDDPLVAIARISTCRIVLTGSYHAGVFALSQGIPVVGLASSPYYCHKFHGLAEQFGTGCVVLDLNDARLSQKLMQALRTSWHTADNVRTELLSAAQKQIEARDQAYRHVCTLAERDRSFAEQSRAKDRTI
ncbi:polysaccharide pyruvyl transferase family protein [Candidatus Chloroploca sp. Khr17]|uniref:polysaccharide pyruvyl transferase family protein n=1 Tax=Candidatus Chloroploca sp. Khr17 TaxID=2496869 RepID=UPI00101C24D5|nr:polysaccharide pyruvyl transferase family protein [Candidatus Chloroploca sp. Khr17]